nr:2-oxoglutarate and iron-dependent oxygenase domain-containing protein [Streptomyces scabichelini]
MGRHRAARHRKRHRAQRLEIENLNSPQFRGYTRTGTEYAAGSADWREQIDIGPERAALDAGRDDPDDCVWSAPTNGRPHYRNYRS